MTALTEGSVLIRFRSASPATPALSLLAVLLAGGLTACGGGANSAAMASPADATEATANAPAIAPAAAAEDAATEELPGEALPTFHMAPASLAEPADSDVGGTNVSASSAPSRFDIDASLAGRGHHAPDTPGAGAACRQRPHARASVSSAAQAHRARGDHAVGHRVHAGADPRRLRPARAAGRGRLDHRRPSPPRSAPARRSTCVDAYHDAERARRPDRVLRPSSACPTCTNVALPPRRTLPLAKAGADLHVLDGLRDQRGAMHGTAPAYNAGWAPRSSSTCNGRTRSRRSRASC